MATKPSEQQFAKLVKEQKSTIYTVCYIFSKDEAFMGDHLIPAALRLQRAKRLSTLQMMVSIPFSILLPGWFLFDFFQSINYENELLTSAAWGGIVGGCIGLVCGLIFSFLLYHKQQKTRQQVIDQINDLTAGNTPES